jgi:hypothetical protein
VPIRSARRVLERRDLLEPRTRQAPQAGIVATDPQAAAVTAHARPGVASAEAGHQLSGLAGDAVKVAAPDEDPEVGAV